jgi:hypothetical protein
MFVVVIVQLPIQALVPLLVNLRQQLRARIHMAAAIAARLHVLVLVLLPRRHHYNICLLPPPSSAILVTKVFGVAGGVMLYMWAWRRLVCRPVPAGARCGRWRRGRWRRRRLSRD